MIKCYQGYSDNAKSEKAGSFLSRKESHKMQYMIF